MPVLKLLLEGFWEEAEEGRSGKAVSSFLFSLDTRVQLRVFKILCGSKKTS